MCVRGTRVAHLITLRTGPRGPRASRDHIIWYPGSLLPVPVVTQPTRW